MIRVKVIHCETDERKEIAQAIGDIANDKLDVVWLKKYVSADRCDKISSKFNSSEAARPRGDNVPGVMVGESHYFKDPTHYYQQQAATEPYVGQPFVVLATPIMEF